MDTEVENLINEVRLLFSVLVQRGEKLQLEQSVTMAQRAVLEFLHKHGSNTVPHIARQRRVSRQHIQALVNPLLDTRLVEKQSNPAHKRSHLIRLSSKGEKTIRTMRQRESKFLDQARMKLSKRRLKEAIEVLQTTRAAIEG